MDMRLAGALFGFIVGVVGYITFKFWLLPIREYRRLKAMINLDIKYYNTAISDNQWNTKNQNRFQTVRKNILDLSDCYDNEIPVWYKIVLRRRRESPHEAAKYLMDLANVKDGTHALKRLEKVRAALLIK